MDDLAKYRLDEASHAEIFADIEHIALATSVAVDSPKAILLGGQPGSGKAALCDWALEELGRNAVRIDADELRKHHPRYIELMREDDRSAADRTHPDAAQWAVKLTYAAANARRNLVIDGTMRDPDSLAVLCTGLRKAGYALEARVLAVDRWTSRMSIIERYERQVESNGFGRWSNTDKHDAAYTGIPATVERLESERLVDRLQVVARGGIVLLDRLLTGTEQAPRGASNALREERERTWSPDRAEAFLSKLGDLRDRMRARGATLADIQVLDTLRHSFQATTAPAAKMPGHTTKPKV